MSRKLSPSRSKLNSGRLMSEDDVRKNFPIEEIEAVIILGGKPSTSGFKCSTGQMNRSNSVVSDDEIKMRSPSRSRMMTDREITDYPIDEITRNMPSKRPSTSGIRLSSRSPSRLSSRSPSRSKQTFPRPSRMMTDREIQNYPIDEIERNMPSKRPSTSGIRLSSNRSSSPSRSSKGFLSEASPEDYLPQPKSPSRYTIDMSKKPSTSGFTFRR